MNNHWLSKYEPNNIDEVVGHEKIKQQLIKYIESVKRGEETNGIYIYGPTGIGKTILAKKCLEHCGFNVMEINSSDNRKSSLINKNLESIMTRMNISIMKVKYTASAVLFDEIDSITKVDKGTIPVILSYIKKKKIKDNPNINYKLPIILISDHRTKSKDIVKHCTIFELTKPTIFNVFPYAKNICKNENIHIGDTELQYLLHKIDIDFRQIIFALSYLKEYFRNKIIDMDKIQDVMQYIFKKDIDYTIMSASSKLINSNVSISDVNYYFDIDQSVIPLIVHENSPTVYNHINDEDIFENVELYYNNIISADIFSTYAHNYIAWDINEYYGLLSCYLPGKTNKSKKKKTLSKVSNIKYTNFFSKNAHLFYNINTKIQLCLKLGLSDYELEHIIEYIIFYFYQNKPLPSFIIDILNKNDITPIEIEKMVKLSIFKDIYEKDNKTIKKKINMYLKKYKLK